MNVHRLCYKTYQVGVNVKFYMIIITIIVIMSSVYANYKCTCFLADIRHIGVCM